MLPTEKFLLTSNFEKSDSFLLKFSTFIYVFYCLFMIFIIVFLLFLLINNYFFIHTYILLLLSVIAKSK